MTEAHPDQSAATLNARIESIMKVPVPQARDGALREIAKDAASSGHPDICVAALGDLSTTSLRKDAGQVCGATLRAKGDAAGASRVEAVR